MRACLIVVVSFWIIASAAAQKPSDQVAQKQAALDVASKGFDEAQRATRDLYDQLDKAIVAARADQAAVWTAELARVIEPVSIAAKAAVLKKGANTRTNLAGVFKKEGGPAFKKLENSDLKLLEPYLSARLAAVAGDIPLEPAPLEPKALAQTVLAELAGEKPVHDLWNGAFADLFPAAEAFRKNWDALDKARWELAIAKDPVMQFQRGAPTGFARVPTGAYVMLGTAGFGTQGARKGKKAVTLAHDVFLGLNEVTQAEYFDWWKGLDEAGKKKNLPLDPTTNQPLWPTKDPNVGPAPTEDQLRRPISCINMASAMLYAGAKGARLPTEAEWCAAAGGKEGRLYPWGDAWQADFCNDLEKKAGDAVAVGSFPGGRGPFGHLDLAGNVAELLATYENGKDVDPAKIEDLSVVVRGGSFVGSKDDASNGWVWFKRALFERGREVGFRLAMDVKK